MMEKNEPWIDNSKMLIGREGLKMLWTQLNQYDKIPAFKLGGNVQVNQNED